MSALRQRSAFGLCFHYAKVEKGGSMELESNKVENAQEPVGMCVNKEQLHSHQAKEE